ncbi:MAG: sensor histidine kinase, partial [Myxococcota bacterium]
PKEGPVSDTDDVLFGFTIPTLTGMLGDRTPAALGWWLAALYFTGLSFAIWNTNLQLLLFHRRRWGANAAGARWPALIGSVVAATTAWIAVGGGGFLAAAGPPTFGAARLVFVAATSVGCAVGVTYIYQTGYLVKARTRDALHVERLEHARAQAELEALRSYIDPHFLFNNLNTLSHLIAQDPDRALAFNDSLAEVYRYILANRDRDLVLLREEVAFLRQYWLLMRLRFGPALVLDHDGVTGVDDLLIPPISLQVLVENAVKHNTFDREQPLELTVWVDGDQVRFRNPRRPKVLARPSTRLGLKTLDERYRHTLGQPIGIEAVDDTFTVTLPLIRVALVRATTVWEGR